ncbi:MAG: hypothetical protein IJ903_05425 [Ruminococcus sp.]|nr:hypothetical protein [Ruminococcus sp.]
MKKLMIIASIISLAAFICFTVMYYQEGFGLYLSLSITFGVLFYHLAMRLIVGYSFNAVMHNKADYENRRYRLKHFELKLYKFLRVKRWKDYMPSYNNDDFDPTKRSWEEIAMATCQSELIHTANVVLSFLPLILVIWFSDFPVFLITSVLAAGLDLMYVIMQRYNRARIVRVIKTKNKLKNK